MKVFRRLASALIILLSGVIVVICAAMAYYLSADICEAAKKGKLTRIRFLVAINSQLVNRTANDGLHDGLTSLQLAIAYGHEDVARFLVASGANVNVRDRFSGAMPLHEAAAAGHKEVVELLLGKGADVNATDKFGAMPLHHAVATGQKEMVELLLAKGANVNAEDNHGNTALDYALKSTHANGERIAAVLRRHSGVK